MLQLVVSGFWCCIAVLLRQGGAGRSNQGGVVMAVRICLQYAACLCLCVGVRARVLI